MHILLFGATGGTGRHVIAQSLEAGHQITAFVRNPAGITIKHKNLTLVKGNILSPEDVQNAVKRHDVVISTLGNKTSQAFTKPNDIISSGVKNIIAAMKKEGVDRLLFVASFGVNKNIFLPEKIFIRTVFKNIFADIPLQEKYIKESGLNWTLVHPARLTDTPKTGKYYVAEDLPIGIFSRISRADVADFLVVAIQNPKFVHKTMTLSY